ncbi:MAG: hypothetical protein A07HN63_01071 [uncultured archaeon A07HN63]|nr:MAG: hypothetical protein A07HN63_01071 [uncultured archaeon A07HN63]
MDGCESVDDALNDIGRYDAGSSVSRRSMPTCSASGPR